MQRSDRVAEEIKKIIGKALATEIHDPQLPPMSSVTDVVVNRDLSVAKIYVSTLGGAENGQILLAVLKRAMPFLRHMTAQELMLRNIPELRFYFDDSIERGLAMDRLIDQVRAEDARRAPQASEDAHAVDADEAETP